MTGTTDPALQQASREATDWLILLQEAPHDPELARRFETWVRQSAVNAAAWAATATTARAIAGTVPALDARWRPWLETARRRSAPSRPLRRWSLAAGAAVAASLAVAAAGPPLMLELRADHRTGTAEVETVRLADDSIVTLAPESAIAVAYAAGERRVELLAGEAFFEVTPDPARPFRVAAGPVGVVVLGTGFDVRRDDAGAEIGVEHGLVRVDHSTAQPPVAKPLAAGAILTVSWSGAIEAGRLPAGQLAAWRRDQLIAQDQPLGAVVDRMRRHFAGHVLVTDRALSERPVTGVYNLADPVEALRAIARAQNAVVRRVTPWLLLVSPS